MCSQYRMAIEELGLSGAVSLGRCSRSTVYRWARECNAILEHERMGWRVRADAKNSCLVRQDP